VNVFGWNVVVFGCHGEIWASNLATVNTQAVESLWARHFVNEVKVDVQQVWFTGCTLHNVAIPNFLGKREGLAVRIGHASIQP
jgi:hypothetical protein